MILQETTVPWAAMALMTTGWVYLSARTDSTSVKFCGRPVLVSCQVIMEKKIQNTRIICHNIAISWLITIITIIRTRVWVEGVLITHVSDVGTGKEVPVLNTNSWTWNRRRWGGHWRSTNKAGQTNCDCDSAQGNPTPTKTVCRLDIYRHIKPHTQWVRTDGRRRPWSFKSNGRRRRGPWAFKSNGWSQRGPWKSSHITDWSAPIHN